MIDSSLHCVYLCLNNSLISLDGINSISINKSTSYDNGIFLGGQDMPLSLNQPDQISISIDKSFVEHDPIQSLTGSGKIDYLYYSDGLRYIEFKNLYMNNMQASFTVGDLPKVNFTLSSYNGHMVQLGSVNTSNKITFEKNIPKLDSIFISSSNAQVANLIKTNIYMYSIDYSVNINRQPYYSVGSYEEVEVCEILPIQVSASITSKEKINLTFTPLLLAEYQTMFYDFDINIKGSGTSITSFPMRKTKFISFDKKSNSNGFADIKYNFNGLIGGYYGN
jgi:hypothetical protein